MKPIFIVNIPLEMEEQKVFKTLDEKLGMDYHVVIIVNNPCVQGRSANRVTYELLNGTFWNYFFLWLKRKRL